MDKVLEMEVGKLELANGDILVVRSQAVLSTPVMERMRDGIKLHLGLSDLKILVLSGGDEVAVIRPGQDDLAERLARLEQTVALVRRNSDHDGPGRQRRHLA